MTIPEACQLVIQAGGIGRPGEVLILDMGEPVRILDVAKRMIDDVGQGRSRSSSPAFATARSCTRSSSAPRESIERPFHPKISHTHVDVITPERLDKAGWEARMFAVPRNNDTTIDRARHEVETGSAA